MPDFFFDTSAILKLYHAEMGTPRVQTLLAVPENRCFISRLSPIELHSALAKKVRSGFLDLGNFDILLRRFRADLNSKHWRVVRLLVSHLRIAERLIRRIGWMHNLRTLDAIQLSAALSLNTPDEPIIFVSADQPLCSIAAAEGLPVINPEL